MFNLKSSKMKHKNDPKVNGSKVVIKNGLRFIRQNGCLVLDEIITGTIDKGFHSYARKNA